MWTVWTVDQYDHDQIVLADIPEHAVAERLAANLRGIFMDRRTWIEKQ